MARAIPSFAVAPTQERETWTYAPGIARLTGVHRDKVSAPNFPAAAVFHRRPALHPEEDLEECLFTADSEKIRKGVILQGADPRRRISDPLQRSRDPSM